MWESESEKDVWIELRLHVNERGPIAEIRLCTSEANFIEVPALYQRYHTVLQDLYRIPNSRPPNIYATNQLPLYPCHHAVHARSPRPPPLLRRSLNPNPRLFPDIRTLMLLALMRLPIAIAHFRPSKTHR